MKLLSIVRGVAAAAIVFVAGTSYSSQPAEAAGTCVVTLIKHFKDACAPGLVYASAGGAQSDDGGSDATVTPTASGGGACIQTLIAHFKNRCPG